MNGVIELKQFSQDGKVSLDEILQSFRTLDTKEVAQFIQETSKMLARRTANVLSPRETELIKAINQTIPNKLQEEYEMLNIKLNTETILPVEYEQLLKIITKIEQKKAKKLELMFELARIRNINLKTLSEQLNLNQGANA